MKKLLVYLAFIAYLLLFIPITTFPSGASTSVDSPYGVTLESKNPLAQTDQSTGWIASTGIQWVRLQEHWDKQQPVAGGVLDFRSSDSQVALSLAHGLRIDWPVQQPPVWAKLPGCSSIPRPALLAQYAVAVYKRYGSKISSFEVGNEEESWEKVCKSPSYYVTDIETVSKALRAAGYTGLIGMFGFTNYHSVADVSGWFDAFLSDKSNPGKYFDYLNFHFYHEGADPNVALPGKPSLPQVLNAIHQSALAHNHGYKPVWLTETGFRTHCDVLHPAPCNAISPQLQSTYLHEILEDGRLSGGLLTHIFLYTLVPGSQVMSIYQNGLPLPAALMIKQESSKYPHW